MSREHYLVLAIYQAALEFDQHAILINKGSVSDLILSDKGYLISPNQDHCCQLHLFPHINVYFL